MENLFNVNQVAFILKVHPLTIRRYIKEGRLKAVKAGGNIRIKESELQDFNKDFSTPRNFFKNLPFEKKNPLKVFSFGSDAARFSVVVPKKLEKSAVKRNRLKRQMREVVRLLLKEEKIKSGFMMVFVAKQDLLGSEYEEIERNMLFLLKKAKIIQGQI